MHACPYREDYVLFVPVSKLLTLDRTQGERDDKIIAVCADDPEYRDFNDINELPPHRLAEIRRFFEDCILLKSCYLS